MKHTAHSPHAVVSFRVTRCWRVRGLWSRMEDAWFTPSRATRTPAVFSYVCAFVCLCLCVCVCACPTVCVTLFVSLCRAVPCPFQIVSTYTEACRTVDARVPKLVGRANALWIQFAKYYEKNEDLEGAFSVFEMAVKAPVSTT